MSCPVSKNVSRRALAAAVLLLAMGWATPARAVETLVRTWRSVADFAPGEMDHVSVSPQGRLVLSPEYRRIAELDEPVAWAVAVAGGDVVVATGHDGKVLRVPPGGGKPSVLLDADELEVYALAVAKDGTVYAGTSPDGKVYRVHPGEQAKVIFDPEERYIWAVLAAPDGAVYVATGDKGAVYRVAPAGGSTAVLTAEETHVLSLALAADGTLYAGSGGNGYVYKVEKGGRTTILVDTAGSEVKALALDAEGDLFAASTGRPAGGPETNPLAEALGGAIPTAAMDDGGSGAYEAFAGTAPGAAAGAGAAAPPVVAQAQGALQAQAPQPQPSASPIPQIPLATLLPGAYSPSGPRQSWLYRIRSDGLPEEIWRSNSETIHSMAHFRGGIALGTGDEGKVLLVDPKTGLQSILLDFPGAQVTGLAAHGDGFEVVTSNLASVWSVGGKPASEGTYTSPVVDAGHFATWGRLTVRSTATTREATRSGNTEKPGARWSAWEDAASGVKSPKGRYVQYRLTLSAGEAKEPEVKDVELAFLPYNLTPRIRSLTVLDPHVELISNATPPAGLAGQTPTRMPPPLRGRSRPQSPDLKPAPREQETYGSRSARWDAEDPNGDELRYAVSVRGDAEAEWKPLADDLVEPFVAFDATALPDGRYVLRVTATDRSANTDDRALQAELESEPFVVDNTAPRVEITDARIDESALRLRARIIDRTSVLEWAEYALDGLDWRPLLPTDLVFDELEEALEVTIEDVGEGEHTLAIRAEDTGRNVGSGKTVLKPRKAPASPPD